MPAGSRPAPSDLRRAGHPSAGPDLAFLADRDHAEVAVNVQADRAADPPRHSHPHLHDATDERENQRDNDTDRYVLEAQSRQVAGAAERKARARSPSSKNGLPACVLPTEAPVPDHPTLRPEPDRDLAVHFHATTSSSGASYTRGG